MNYYFDDLYSHRVTLNYGKIRDLTEQIISEYSVATPNADVSAKSLSGGNLQKMILARVLSRQPKLVIADIPTQGLDIGATEFVRNKLVEAKRNGAGVLLVSEDLDEIFELSDWVAPIYEGRIMDIIPGDQVKREQVGAMMAGLHLEEET
jgi:simple sugar transport system ATP-binding protein